MGFTPHRAAKAGSDLSRSGLLPAVGCGVRSDSEGVDNAGAVSAVSRASSSSIPLISQVSWL